MPNLTRRPSLRDVVLRPFALQLAQASRLAGPSSNKLITSIKSSHCVQPRFVIDFSCDDGREKIQGWYRRQSRNTRFTSLEYRKAKQGRVKHEFIVVWLNSTTLCRFDRRPRDNERGYVLVDEGAPAEDSAQVLSVFEAECDELMRKTEVLLTINFPDGEDLSFILAVCEAIQTHAKAVAYNLMRYNCYFFSWMIVTAVSRRTYNWETTVLSKSGWDDILQTSLAHTFPDFRRKEDKPEPTLPRQVGKRRWLNRIVARLRIRRQCKTQSLMATPGMTDFIAVLLSQYAESHDTIQAILKRLLLRSQLGSSLSTELHRIKSSGFILAMVRAVQQKMDGDALKPDNQLRGRRYFWYDQEITAATRATAAILATKQHSDKSTDICWETVWKRAWDEEHAKLMRPFDEDAIRFFYKHGGYSEEARDKTMREWKNAWDKIDGIATHYTTLVTTTVMTTMLEQLTDVAPSQLSFGPSIQCHNDLDRTESPPSLQGFIRSRMRNHFEMVDRFGFGSFQELITTAEEAMCEIWVASLDIVECGHFKPQRISVSSAIP